LVKKLLKIIVTIFLVINIAFTSNSNSINGPHLKRNMKILTVYFSHSGNTHVVAGYVHKIMGGNIVRIEVVNPYPRDYENVKKRSTRELSTKFNPVLKTKIKNINSYDVLLIGYPNWWNTFPPPIRTFLSKYDLNRKIIIPFCTHGGGGFGQSIIDIKKLIPKSTIVTGFAIMGSNANESYNEVLKSLMKIVKKLNSLNIR